MSDTQTSGTYQSTLDGDSLTPLTCEPPGYPDENCENVVDRCISVYYGGPASITIHWTVCEDHSDDVRETGEVRDERDYRETKIGFEVVDA